MRFLSVGNNSEHTSHLSPRNFRNKMRMNGEMLSTVDEKVVDSTLHDRVHDHEFEMMWIETLVDMQHIESNSYDKHGPMHLHIQMRSYIYIYI